MNKPTPRARGIDVLPWAAPLRALPDMAVARSARGLVAQVSQRQQVPRHVQHTQNLRWCGVGVIDEHVGKSGYRREAKRWRQDFWPRVPQERTRGDPARCLERRERHAARDLRPAYPAAAVLCANLDSTRASKSSPFKYPSRSASCRAASTGAGSSARACSWRCRSPTPAASTSARLR